ncbi:MULTISPECIES: S46 family peptidase [Rhizobium]|uniref:Dipeptidyl-peptidase n=1 Tax=Rhizobium favelukesii TaxID=348824 RepID=W6RGW8_9HYPH|nr:MULTISPECIES: S46 family peptidase [Rhizobium]MCS0462376.1 S46 family peptidase [Rhizobium favelukesii]UFS85047.1 S46 family peptidase [Rhizobium sp. T136]CDM60054.1 peptidase S46 family protein [Rhizobium favelukesii]
MNSSMKYLAQASAAALLSTAAAASANEGMWMPGQTAELGAAMRADGLQIDPAQLSRLDAYPLSAIVSLDGCSASFVSPQGLVATNHHCVLGSIQYNSTESQDYLTNGFLAKSLDEELPAAPDSRIYVIEDMRDVTADMLKGVSDKLNGFARYERLEANRKALIAVCEEQPNRRCGVRFYYGGASYYLEQKLEIEDVRLVYAPALGIGNFGGETDNWMWPRHTGDFGFYRAYVAPDGSSRPYARDNVPYRPKSWLRIASEGVQEGDFVMVAGFPGATYRFLTAGEMEFNFAHYEPLQQHLLSNYASQITQATAGNRDAQIGYAPLLQGVENYEKKLAGDLAGVDAIGLSARKATEEKAYRDWVADDPARQARYGAAIRELDAMVAENSQVSFEGLRQGLLDSAQMLSSTRTLYRWAKEHEKPDDDRERGFQDRDRNAIADRLKQLERRYLSDVDRKLFEAALEEYRRLDAKDRDTAFETALEQIGLDRLYGDTKLDDTATRFGWLDKPAAAFEASDDPFIRLAVALYPGDIAAERAEKDRVGRTQAARATYMRGLLAYRQAVGRPMYPDANGSLRLTWGKVTGQTRDGQIWTPFTTAEGLLAKHTGKGEFDAPVAAIAAIRAKDYGPYVAPAQGTLPVDFISTVDITNGNSGSATLNGRGEFVGLAFDGVLEGVISDWAAPIADRTRSIHVDSRFILWTMDKIDDAGRLLKEMGVRPASRSGADRNVDK